MGVRAFGSAAFEVAIVDASIGPSSAGPAISVGDYAQVKVRRSVLRGGEHGRR